MYNPLLTLVRNQAGIQGCGENKTCYSFAGLTENLQVYG